MKQKNNNTLVIILGLITAILLLSIGYVLGKIQDTKLIDEIAKPEEKIDNGQVSETKELDINDSVLVNEADSIIPTGICGYEYFPFKEKNITLDDLTDQEKLEMIYRRFVNYDPEVKIQIREWEIEKYFEDLSFLDSVKTKKIEFDAGSMSYSDGIFVLQAYATGCEGAGEGYRRKLIKATTSKDKLEITYSYYYMSYDYEKEKYQLYNKLGDKTPIYDNVDINENREFVLNGKELDYSVFNNYILTFDISNNNMRFEKMIYNKA